MIPRWKIYLPLLMVVAAVATWEAASQSRTFKGTHINVFEGPVLSVAGSVTAPSIGWAADADGTGTGFYRGAADRISVTSGGVDVGYIENGSWRMFPAGVTLHLWTTLLHNEGSGILQLGADNSTPVNQTLTSHDGSGSNIPGGDLILSGGQGTGSGRGGAIREQTSTNGAAAVSQNGAQDRRWVAAKEVTLTESTATLVFSNSLASGKWVSMKVFASTYASDGTDFQVVSEVFTIAAVNKAGTVTTTVSASTPTATQQSSGTLATTWTAVANGNGIDVKNSAVSSLTQTALGCKWRVEIDGNDSNLITPQ